MAPATATAPCVSVTRSTLGLLASRAQKHLHLDCDRRSKSKPPPAGAQIGEGVVELLHQLPLSLNSRARAHALPRATTTVDGLNVPDRLLALADEVIEEFAATSVRATGWRIICARSGSGPRWWWGCAWSAHWRCWWACRHPHTAPSASGWLAVWWRRGPRFRMRRCCGRGRECQQFSHSSPLGRGWFSL